MPQKPEATIHQSLRRDCVAFSSQLFNVVLYTRVAEITDAIGNEVNTLYQGTTIDPLLARMPAFDRRRVQDLLPHMFHLVEYGFKARLGGSPIADQTHRADNRLYWALNPGKAGVLESIGIEQDPQHGADVISGPEVLVFQPLDRLWVLGWGIHPRRHLRVGSDQVIVQMVGQEAGGGWLLIDDINNVLTVEIPGVAQESLFAVIVVSGVVNEFCGIAAVGLSGNAVGNGPSGKSPGAFLHILLGVVEVAVHAHTHGEQLQQLPSIVLVDSPFMAQAIVQEVDNGRVSRNIDQQIRECAHPA